MLQTYPGADGLKTGYIEASGYNVVTSAVRGNVRLIGVVLGAANGGERDLHMAALLDQGFRAAWAWRRSRWRARSRATGCRSWVGARAAPMPPSPRQLAAARPASRPAGSAVTPAADVPRVSRQSAHRSERPGRAGCRRPALRARDARPRARRRRCRRAAYPRRTRVGRYAAAPASPRAHGGLRATRLQSALARPPTPAHFEHSTERDRPPDGRRQRRTADHDPHAGGFRRHARGRPARRRDAGLS